MTHTYDPVLAVMQRRRARDSFVHSETRTVADTIEATQAILTIDQRLQVVESFIRDAAKHLEPNRG